MGYWGKVARRAFAEARAEVRFDKPVRIVTSIVTPLVAGAVVWYFSGSLAWTGIVTVGLLLLVGVCVFIERVVSVPAAMASEQAAALDEVRDQLKKEVDQERWGHVFYLTDIYVNEVKPPNAETISRGLEHPPEDWVNDRLDKLGFDWRVRFRPGAKVETYDV